MAEIELEVLTPMFSYGHGKDAIPEFRITELKALMRSTFRELYYFNSIKDMREKEKNLFGSIEKKSPIVFFIKKNIDRDKDLGYEYLLQHDKKRFDPILCIKESVKISFNLICKNEADIDFYVKLLIQSSIIGALGRRSRKGFGSFKINSIVVDDSKEDYNDLINKDPIDILKIQNSEYKIRQFVNDSEDERCLKYNELHEKDKYPYVNKISVIKLSNNLEYIKFIEKISQLTHYRLKKQEQHSFLNDIEVNEKIDKSILGNFFTPKNERNKDYIKGLSRFASPVYVSFWENNENRYMMIKELNYGYILTKLKLQEELVQNKSIEYVNKYVQRLIDIGDGQAI